jgi:hypothetical protein
MPNNDEIERLIKLMHDDDSFDAPEDAIKWAKNIFRSRKVKTETGFVGRILAVLQFDSSEHVILGERSLNASTTRQMFFVAENNAVDLRIERIGKKANLTGQIIGEGLPKGKINLIGNDKTYSTSADESKAFSFKSIPADGEYSMFLQVDEKEIVIPSLRI